MRVSDVAVRISASNSSVKPLPGRAHGAATGRIPHLPQRTRGIRALRCVSYSKKFRCRHRRCSVSYALHPAAPHSGHGNTLPRSKSIDSSSFFWSASSSTDDTNHGLVRPSASANRSRSLIRPTIARSKLRFDRITAHQPKRRSGSPEGPERSEGGAPAP